MFFLKENKFLYSLFCYSYNFLTSCIFYNLKNYSLLFLNKYIFLTLIDSGHLQLISNYQNLYIIVQKYV